jgi:hypothetical protein
LALCNIKIFVVEVRIRNDIPDPNSGGLYPCLIFIHYDCRLGL